MKKSLEQRVDKLEKKVDEVIGLISLVAVSPDKKIEIKNDATSNWVSIDYTKIPKETFEKYGCKPFEILERKMRNDKDEVWNNISFTDAKAEAEKLGYRLPSIQEMLVLLDIYKKEYPNSASIYHQEFLGIKELSYDESVYLEWIDAPSPAVRGDDWSYGSAAGAFPLTLYWGTGGTNNYVGFRCAR